MRLASVEISNYRVLRHAAIEFPDSLIGIIGPNGAGKSSLVEAVSWALYGQQAARSARAEVKSTFASPDEPCEVQLTFAVRGEEHRVIRRLVGAGQRLEVELYRGGRLEVVGSTETQQYIERLLGLDWRGYVTSVYARQSDLDAFSGLQPARRREHLVAMLGIDRLDRAIDRAKADMRIDAERAVLLEKQTAAISELEGSEKRIGEKLIVAQQELVDADGARAVATRRLKEIEAQHAEHERKKSACSQAETHLETARAERRHLSERLAQMTAERTGLERLQIQTDVDRPKLAQLEPIRAEVRQLEKAKEAAKTRTRIAGELESARRQRTVSEKLGEELTSRVVAIQRSLAEVASVSPRDLEAARSELERAREQYVQMTEQKKQAEKEARTISENLAQIASLGGEAVCSRCLRPYGTDLEQIRGHLRSELSAAEMSVNQMDGKLRESAQMGAALKEKASRLEKSVDEQRTLQQSLELTETQRKQAESQRAMLAERVDSLQRQLAETGDVAYDEARWKELSTRLTELEALDRRNAEATGQLKRLPIVQEMMINLGAQVHAADARIAELERQRTDVAFDPQAFEDSLSGLQRATAATRTAEDRYVQAVHARELLTAEAASVDQRLAALRDLAEDLKVVRSRRSRTDRLARIFGDLRHNLVAGIRPRLAEIGSELLEDMTAGRYNQMELDEDYNISVSDNGQAFGIDRFSGGESDLANLCLRLAVSLALAESAGLERSLVILDEVFGSQDESRRELIYRGLAALKPRFPQIIAITHIEELKNRVETLIEIVPTGSGWSEVRVDGVVA